MMGKKSVVCIVWSSHVTALKKAASLVGEGGHVFCSRDLEKDEDAVLRAVNAADALFVYRGADPVWCVLDEPLERVRQGGNTPLICVASDPGAWGLSTVSSSVAQKAYRYLTFGGADNAALLLQLLHALAQGKKTEDMPDAHAPLWEGLWHPDAAFDIMGPAFEDVASYEAWYAGHCAAKHLDGPVVGLLFGRHYWVNGMTEVEAALVHALEGKGLRVLPVFANGLRDAALGNKGGTRFGREVFLDAAGSCRIQALIKLLPYFSRENTSDGAAPCFVGDDSPARDSVLLFRELDVPVFQPVFSSAKSVEEWAEDPQGLGSEVAWAVALPEFEGIIEPFFLGGSVHDHAVDKVGSVHDHAVDKVGSVHGQAVDKVVSLTQKNSSEVAYRAPVAERIQRFTARVARWLRLRATPANQRKVAFILHNDPCSSAEATVGGAAGLDTPASLHALLHDMHAAGYSVEVPQSGQALMEDILSRRAVSEFRWTTTKEIVAKGGVVGRVSLEQFGQWASGWPASLRERMDTAWGAPGEGKDGVPAAMFLDGNFLVTGVTLGNAVVCVQPKRGCAGARCDGKVCRILHDPDIPPPHQYLATYRWLQDCFGADIIVHVGTHGTLEFLPGKATGLSASCLPDAVLHEVPHLYIYNANNPAEAVMAKRRSYAALVNHMRPPQVQGGLTEVQEALESYLGQWEQTRHRDPARAHQLEHLIREAMHKAGLDAVEAELRQKQQDADFAALAVRLHETLDLLRNTFVDDGLHVLGALPQGQSRLDFLTQIFRYEGASPEDVRAALKGQKEGEHSLSPRIRDAEKRLTATTEKASFLHALGGGYVTPGPSGLLGRGREDILPTGRNSYTLDPRRLPTEAAWRVGNNLALGILAKHLKEEGRYPENVAMFWMCNDLMWADGEGLAQLLALMGAKPHWQGGTVTGFDIIPLEQLGRPRIDITVRVSGLLRDAFPEALRLLDSAVQAVAALDEKDEQNFVRKHSQERLRLWQEESAAKGTTEAADLWRRATLRVFSSKPGVYQGGVDLAVHASAWHTESDLADIFVRWNSYAYGDNVWGSAEIGALTASLSSVDITYNKVVSDEHDLLNCCAIYGIHGGMTAAASHIKGKPVRVYFGDTREPQHVQVRDMADEIRRVVRGKLLNPRWIEGMKRHGYKGAGDMAKRAGRVYGWDATTGLVDDSIFDDMARTFVLDADNRTFFEENNPWALEEMSRRLLEAEARGVWKADPLVLRDLRQRYLDMEGWLEERTETYGGEFQGGSIDIIVEPAAPLSGGISKKECA